MRNALSETLRRFWTLDWRYRFLRPSLLLRRTRSDHPDRFLHLTLRNDLPPNFEGIPRPSDFSSSFQSIKIELWAFCPCSHLVVEGCGGQFLPNKTLGYWQ